MYGNEREKEIMKLLEENNYVTVDYLAKKIHISPSSIRRDLKRLEMKGQIIRSYGGAELNTSMNKQIPFEMRSHQNTQEKAWVAKRAAALVKNGDVLFMDCSTSTHFMIKYLKNIKDITIITNSLSALNTCSEYNLNCFSTGGRLSNTNRTCLFGSHTESAIRSFHADFFFFSVQSLAPNGVLYECFQDEITPRKLMMENAEKSVFLCDHSKTNHYSAYRLCDMADIDYVISDVDIFDCMDGDVLKKYDHFKNTVFIHS